MKMLLTLFTASVLLLAACQKDKDETPPELTTEQKMAGKWKVEKIKAQFYSPVTVLLGENEYTGTASDSVVFKTGGQVYLYDGSGAPDIQPYAVIKKDTISIDGDKYAVKELTATKFRLYADDVNTATDERTVTDMYLYR